VVEGIESPPGEGASLPSRLGMAYGSPAPALQALNRALLLAGRAELPGDPSELVAFVHAHLLPILIAEIGPRLSMALVDDLVADLAPVSSTLPLGPPESPRALARVSLRSRTAAPRKTELSVLLVDLDRVWRSMLARDLVRVRWGVSAIDQADELGDVIQPGEPIDVAIIDVRHPHAAAIVDAVVSAFPTVVVVARASSPAKAQALLGGRGLTRLEVRSPDAPAEELIQAVRRLVES
jgi:hypothetical protein